MKAEFSTPLVGWLVLVAVSKPASTPVTFTEIGAVASALLILNVDLVSPVIGVSPANH